MATLQICIDDMLNENKDPAYSLQEAVYDSRFRRNLNGTFDNAEDAVASMLED